MGVSLKYEKTLTLMEFCRLRENLTQMELPYRTARCEVDQPAKPIGGSGKVAPPFLCQPDLGHRSDVIGMLIQHDRELRDPQFELTQRGVCPTELPAGIAIVGMVAQPLDQLSHPAVVIPGLGVGEFEIALSQRHSGVEFNRRSELLDRFLDQTLAKVEDAKVVARTRVGTIDAASKGAEHFGLPFRKCSLHVVFK